jgi:hypothetical protein
VECIRLIQAGAVNSILGAALAIEAMLHERSGDAHAGLRARRESVSSSYSLGDRSQLGFALYEVVATFATCGETTVATEIAGWLHGGVHESLYRYLFDRDEAQGLVRLRDRLGDHDFERAMTEGAALTLDEAVERALTTLDALLAEPPDDER